MISAELAFIEPADAYITRQETGWGLRTSDFDNRLTRYSMKEIIAEKDLIGIEPDGSRFMIMLKIGMPYAEGDEWVCPIGAIGLHPELREVRAPDSFQALMRGCNLLQQILEFFLDDGGKILSPDDQKPLSLDDIFS